MKQLDGLQAPHPLHAIVLAFPTALFTSAVITDIAYLRTAEIQWSNFSAWLIAGGLLGGGIALLIGAVEYFRIRPAARRALLYPLLLLGMFVIGFINALLHARDAWYSVTAAGLLLSIITALLALAAAWIRHAGGRI